MDNKENKKRVISNDYKSVDIDNIYNDIKEKILAARGRMLKHIDTTMTEVYWYVGKITSELFETLKIALS